MRVDVPETVSRCSDRREAVATGRTLDEVEAKEVRKSSRLDDRTRKTYLTEAKVEAVRRGYVEVDSAASTSGEAISGANTSGEAGRNPSGSRLQTRIRAMLRNWAAYRSIKQNGGQKVAIHSSASCPPRQGNGGGVAAVGAWGLPRIYRVSDLHRKCSLVEVPPKQALNCSGESPPSRLPGRIMSERRRPGRDVRRACYARSSSLSVAHHQPTDPQDDATAENYRDTPRTSDTGKWCDH
jgi:hypothetical protein